MHVRLLLAQHSSPKLTFKAVGYSRSQTDLSLLSVSTVGMGSTRSIAAKPNRVWNTLIILNALLGSMLMFCTVKPYLDSLDLTMLATKPQRFQCVHRMRKSMLRQLLPSDISDVR